MTPLNIRAVFGFSVEEFSQLLGVSASTTYRWEQQETAPRIDPLQRKVLGLLEDLVTDDKAANEALAIQIRRGLLTRGTLGGMYVLLAKTYETRQQQEPPG